MTSGDGSDVMNSATNEESSSSAKETTQLVSQKEEKRSCGYWFCLQHVPKRYVLSMMGFIGFSFVYGLRVNMSVAIVAMVNGRTTYVNGTAVKQPADFDWDHRLQGLVLSAFFYGYFITQIPGGWLAKSVGGKHIYGLGVLFTGVLSLLTQPMARLSVYALVILRTIMGATEGVTYPAMHAMWSKWAPPLECSKLATISFAGAYFGTVVSNSLSGIIAEEIGWPWIFYIFGSLAIVWWISWCFIISQTPAEHPTITKEERQYIQTCIGEESKKYNEQAVPWMAFLMSGPVWATVLAHFSENWGFYTMLTELPSFISDAFHFNLMKAGFLAAIPYIVITVTIIISGQLVDFARSHGVSTTVARKVCTCTGFLSQAIFLVSAGYTTTPWVAITCLTFGVGMGGFAISGYKVNQLDLAPQFASIILGISTTVATFSGIISPNVAGAIVKTGAISEWRIVFYIAAGVYLFGAISYALFASGERQPWAKFDNDTLAGSFADGTPKVNDKELENIPEDSREETSQ